MTPNLFDFDKRLDRLTPAERECYKRAELMGQPIARVADITGRERTTVRTLLFRARCRLGEQPEVPT